MKLFGLFIILSQVAFADCSKENAVPNKYMVRLKSQIAAHAQGDFVDYLKVNKVTHNTVFNPSSKPNAQELKSLPPLTLAIKVKNDEELTQIAKHPYVATVEHECLYKLQTKQTLSVTTSDPKVTSMWNLKKIQAEDAWSITRGSMTVIVGISDGGVDYNHEDLKANMWVNKKENPANGIDDDGNGCVDDVHGCDVADKDGDPAPSTVQTINHGSHVAGTAAAVGNNGLGISGIAQSASIMVAKAFASEGSAGGEALLKSIYYLVDNGAQVINCSWGRWGAYSQVELDAFEYAYNRGVVVVTAAGNDYWDVKDFAPANLPHVISVASTDSQDQLSPFSNWGDLVEVAAPGGKEVDKVTHQMIDGILSTMVGNKYGELMGTSMAAPHVTGVVALLLSINPKLTPAEVLKYIQNGGDPIHVTVKTWNKEFDYKRLNAFGSVKLLLSDMGILPPCFSVTANCAANNSKATGTMLNTKFSQGAGCGSIDSKGMNVSLRITGLFLFLSPLLLWLGLRRLSPNLN